MKKTFSFRTIILTASLLLHLGTFCSRSHAAAGDVDLSFDAGSAVNGTVSAIALQPDGKVLVGGPLTFINGTNGYGSVRLNENGSVDSAFVPRSFYPDIVHLGFHFDHHEFTAFAVQPDGKILVAIYYLEALDCDESGCRYNTHFSITRHHADGTRDLDFEPVVQNTYYPDQEFVSELGVQSDGKIVVGGRFASIKGVIRSGLARLNASGSLDTNFAGEVPLNSTVSVVVVQPNDKLMIGSTADDGIGQLARLDADGNPDLGFDPGPIIGIISSVAVQSDGKVLIGGSFTNVSGTTRNRIARLNADGSLDSSFDPGSGVSGTVSSLLLQPDGKVVIGGHFFTVNGTNCNRVARLNANGSLDGSFRVTRGLESPVSQLALVGGKVLVGGRLTFVNGASEYGSARLNGDGSLDGTFSPGSFNPVVIDLGNPHGSWIPLTALTAFAAQPDGKVLAGGSLSQVLDCGDDGCLYLYSPFVVRFHSDGSPDTGFTPYVGLGNFNIVEPVHAVAVQSDGRVLVGHGGWSSVEEAVIRLHPDGMRDTSFNTSLGSLGDWASSIASQPDGKVLIGGRFTAVLGMNRHGIARLHSNGSVDDTFDPGAGANDTVLSVVLQPDGKVLIGGDFTRFNGTARNRIARLNANGSLDLSFDPGTGADAPVRSIALQPDGNVLIGGDFTTVNGVVRSRIARLHGAAVAPSLTIARSNAFVVVSWPVTGLNFQLQETTNLSLPNSWSPVTQAAVTNAGQISVAVPTTVGRKFFRLNSQ